MTSYIILAAGLSTRFNSPKALAQINKELCINYLLKKIITCPIAEIILVTGAHHDLIYTQLLKHHRIHVIYNHDYTLGQTSSVIAALKSSNPSSQWYAIHPIDCPFIKTQTLINLLKHTTRKTNEIIIPCFNKRKGHPAIFNHEIKKAILKLSLTEGVNSIFQKRFSATTFVETKDQGVLQTFNTQEELQNILKNRRRIIP